MNDDLKQYEVVVVGGGFAGIEVSRILGNKNIRANVTLVSNQTCFQYYPNLYRLVVGATPNQVSIPLSKAVPKHVTFVQDTYTAFDAEAHTVTLESGKTLPYDFLVLALGSQPNYFGIDGMEEKSKSFLSVEKSLALNKYFIDLVKDSKKLTKEEAEISLRTIIVGAGPSGVELAGRLPEYLKGIAKEHGVNQKLIKIDLLDSSSRVLSSIPARASALVEKQLKKQGVTFHANYGVNSCDEKCIVATEKTADGKENKKELHAGTVIWTAGTKINTAFSAIPNVVLTERKRVEVSPTLTLPNNDDVYIAGDGSGTPFSGLAQTAIDQGKYVGQAIAKRILKKPVEPYVPRPGAFVIPVGKYWAIFNFKEFTISGFAPYIIRILADAQYFLSITSIKYMFSMLKKQK